MLDTNIEENIQLNQNEKLDNKINIKKEIKEEENAEIVKKELVEEHEDIHQISNRNLNEDEIFISNLPFNASKEDIRKIFYKYGRIKKIKWHKDFSRKNKYFCFINRYINSFNNNKNINEIMKIIFFD